jgi:general secretion pathway protein D
VKKIFLLIVIIIPSIGYSAQSNKKTSLFYYVTQVSKLTEKKYMMNKELKGHVKVSKNFILDKANADDFLSSALFLNGYTRVPLRDNKGFMIINSRDVRYTPVPQFNSSKTNLSQIPNNHDYYQLTYTAKNPQLMTEFSRSVRPFLSRYGRIINSKFTDLIIIQDTGVNLKRLYRLAQKFDNPLDDNLKDKFEKYEDQKFELKKLQSSNNCNHQDTYSKK